ncbi:hypothetical protein CspeluHIS016_0500830 [Cutaneotrichosporon spelunceum]|uniref:Uncharacterized protein n=1 Tax=Cutaneotrichosporon spelunceum TaxID=1672016 RepID=A0AAD3TWV5_9TREE|nr:hypothetical protein CspeluHIS016_0500830 [Cutaneotrichosporon spelunceum]
MDDAFYRSQRALSSDEAMVSAHTAFQFKPPSGLITPPRTPPACLMDLDPPTTPTAPTASLRRSTIPANAFPHVIDAIFAYASNDGLAALRTACQSWCDRADALLLSHVILQSDCQPFLPGGGPIRSDWHKFPVHTLDLVDLNLIDRIPLPPKVDILRARSIAHWDLRSLPRSNTLVLTGKVSDGGYGPNMRTWAPYLSRTHRLVSHYNPNAPETGAWGSMARSLRLSLDFSYMSSFSLQEIVFVFSGTANVLDLCNLGPLAMLCGHLGWETGQPPTIRITLVNALPWFAAAVDAGEALTGTSEDVLALFLRAAGFGPAPDEELKRKFGPYFSFVTFDEYRGRVGDEQFRLEMEVPRHFQRRLMDVPHRFQWRLPLMSTTPSPEEGVAFSRRLQDARID